MLVQVELEDLETIIFATVVIKQIETALVQQRRDPFVQPHLDYKKAHDNLVTAMNHARRANAGTAIDWDGKLTWKEFSFLHDVNEKFEKTSDYTKIDGEL